MDDTELQANIDTILLVYRTELQKLENELSGVISEYQKAADAERIKELRQQLGLHG